ncbi:MAG TPA: tRNA 2-thiocytidine(32) synthetase TtcA [Lachnospiraceae bacterium]|nr:tRNA 2-thiocytidine(32) synthetase TtcA [Lachnospiraceae bacterium]
METDKYEISLYKKFGKEIWRKFIKGVRNYKLIEENDKIAVCISGGKDSMLMAKCMQRLQRYSDVPFSVEYLVMDPGYNTVNRKKIEENAALLNIPIKIFESDIFEAVETVDNSPCYLCARMRRGHLYKNAQELGCNKIALGHHFDDVIETIVMGMFYGGQFQTMMPKLHSTNFEGMSLIRPLYMVREEDIIAWRDYNKLEFIQCACRFTDNYTHSADGIGESKRQEIKALLTEMRKKSSVIDMNIFRSAEKVKTATIISYEKDGQVHSFLDEYEEYEKRHKKSEN